MNRPFSVYLDLVRFCAAMAVYVYHSNQRFLIEQVLPASNFGHSAVIVFFVLSGFVIAYITDTKEKTWPEYTASRFSRVFSVAVPAIFLTVLLDTLGRQLYPEIYSGYPYDQFPVRIASSLLLTNEVWFVSITGFSNVPYWSICYEWWYYVVFGILMFFPARLAALVAVATMLLIGPKLILLAPIWWLGVLLYRWRLLRDLSLGLALLLVILSVAGIVLYHAQGWSEAAAGVLKGMLSAEAHRQLTFSKFFPADYLLGLFVFINFAGCRVLLARWGKPLLAVERPVRFLASYTFTLYLLHQPLFLFWGSVLRGDPKGPWYWLAVTALMLLCVGIVGYFTENRRQGLKRFVCDGLGRLAALPLLARSRHG